jgi:hypothetical protein
MIVWLLRDGLVLPARTCEPNEKLLLAASNTVSVGMNGFMYIRKIDMQGI